MGGFSLVIVCLALLLAALFGREEKIHQTVENASGNECQVAHFFSYRFWLWYLFQVDIRRDFAVLNERNAMHVLGSDAVNTIDALLLFLCSVLPFWKWIVSKACCQDGKSIGFSF